VSAHDHLSGDQFFHVSSAENRESIEAHGLDHSRGQRVWEGHDYPAGNYLFQHEQAAHDYAHYHAERERDEYGEQALPYDVYRVKATTVQPDPEWGAKDRGAVYTHERIPPHAVEHVATH
jgi:hypothetical protein